jgi:hypothetical protein
MAARILCACATTLLSEKKHAVSSVIYQTALQQLSVNVLCYVDNCHTVKGPYHRMHVDYYKPPSE